MSTFEPTPSPLSRTVNIAAAALGALSVLPLAASTFVYGTLLFTATTLGGSASGTTLNWLVLAFGVALLALFMVCATVLAVYTARNRRVPEILWYPFLLVLVVFSVAALWDVWRAAPGFAVVGPLSAPAFPVFAWLLWLCRPHNPRIARQQ